MAKFAWNISSCLGENTDCWLRPCSQTSKLCKIYSPSTPPAARIPTLSAMTHLHNQPLWKSPILKSCSSEYQRETYQHLGRQVGWGWVCTASASQSCNKRCLCGKRPSHHVCWVHMEIAMSAAPRWPFTCRRKWTSLLHPDICKQAEAYLKHFSKDDRMGQAGLYFPVCPQVSPLITLWRPVSHLSCQGGWMSRGEAKSTQLFFHPFKSSSNLSQFLFSKWEARAKASLSSHGNTYGKEATSPLT